MITPEELYSAFYPGARLASRHDKKYWDIVCSRVNDVINSKKQIVDEQTDDGQGFPLESP